MRALLALATSLALFGTAAFARVTREPRGRTPRPPSRLESPRLWSDQAGAFALERPTGDRWSFRGDARGPDGEPLPLLAQSVDSGAQLIIQSADGVTSVRALTRLLADHLGTEAGVRVQAIENVASRGGEAYGFAFTVSDEARGRVAGGRAGDHVALVSAGWPIGAPPTGADEVEEMVGTLGPAASMAAAWYSGREPRTSMGDNPRARATLARRWCASSPSAAMPADAPRRTAGPLPRGTARRGCSDPIWAPRRRALASGSRSSAPAQGATI